MFGASACFTLLCFENRHWSIACSNFFSYIGWMNIYFGSMSGADGHSLLKFGYGTQGRGYDVTLDMTE